MYLTAMILFADFLGLIEDEEMRGKVRKYVLEGGGNMTRDDFARTITKILAKQPEGLEDGLVIAEVNEKAVLIRVFPRLSDDPGQPVHVPIMLKPAAAALIAQVNLIEAVLPLHPDVRRTCGIYVAASVIGQLSWLRGKPGHACYTFSARSVGGQGAYLVKGVYDLCASVLAARAKPQEAWE